MKTERLSICSQKASGAVFDAVRINQRRHNDHHRHVLVAPVSRRLLGSAGVRVGGSMILRDYAEVFILLLIVAVADAAVLIGWTWLLMNWWWIVGMR